uniref:Integral membrane protein GPR137 n=1 Tax=Bos mutus grunniens TaxID=30521 RepID=A0A8B9YZ25_BOSMU
MESNLSGLVPAAGLVPALPPAVTLGLTAAYTTLYALLFFSVYAQLWLVLLYGHKRLSYQTVFLALCLLWAALRTTLFSFYFETHPEPTTWGPCPLASLLLSCLPAVLHTDAHEPLLCSGGVQSQGKASARDEPRLAGCPRGLRGGLAALSAGECAVRHAVPRRRAQPWALLLVRVLVSDSCLLSAHSLLPPASALWPGPLHQHLPGGQGDQCVPGSCNGWRHGPALCQPGLLQPGGPGLGPGAGWTPRLRLVQRL